MFSRLMEAKLCLVGWTSSEADVHKDQQSILVDEFADIRFILDLHDMIAVSALAEAQGLECEF